MIGSTQILTTLFVAAFSLTAARSAAPDSESLKQEIAELRAEDVAWRKVAWRTCLLDGLKASREQKKPVILWVFIDRPIDDKRC